MKITLIRHGETEGNVKRLYYGASDLPILPESEQKLRDAAAKGAYPSFPRYYTSGMLRAEQTFRAIYGDTPHGVLRDMREIDFGRFEMRPYEELKNDPEYIEWITGDFEKNVCPGGESGEIVTERAYKALMGVVNEGEDALIITHGGVIGGVLSKLFPCEEGRYRFTPEPGCGYTVEFEEGKPVGLFEFNAGRE